MFEATEVMLEPGTYRARLADVEEADGSNFDTGEPEKYRRWTFGLVEEGYEGQEIFASSTMAFGPQSKARKWVEALLGRKVQAGEKLELEDLVGKQADLAIVLRDTDRGTFPRVEGITPVRKSQKVLEKESVPTEEDFDAIPF